MKSLQVIKDKEFRRKLLIIAFPVVLQNLINFGISAADTIMVGRLGEVQLSAAAISNQFTFIFMIITFGIAMGCSVLSAQFWGAGDIDKIRSIFSFMFRMVAVLSLVFLVLTTIFPQFILSIIVSDAQVINEGVRYLRIIGISFAFWGFTMSAIGLLRSTGTVNIAVTVSFVSFMINITLNYCLIFGHFGLPALGIQGAAVATVIARFCEFVIILVFVFKVEKTIGLRWAHLAHRTSGIAKNFMKNGAPVVVNELVWVSGNFLLSVIIGQMGREYVAANAIGGLMIQLVGIVIFGISSATGVMIGNIIGEGEEQKAKQYANGMLFLSVLIGLASFVVIQIVRIPVLSFYNLSELTRVYAEQVTFVISIITFFMAISNVSLMGTLRGGGDTRFVMVADVIFTWVFAIPFGALAGLVLHWPVYVVFMILRSEDIMKAAVVFWRVPRGRWLRNVTK